MSTLADDNEETLCELLSLRLEDLADLSGTMVAPDELNLKQGQSWSEPSGWPEWTHESAGPSALGIGCDVLCMNTGPVKMVSYSLYGDLC